MGNDGLRFTFDRRGGRFYFSISAGGELFEDNRGYDSLPIAAQAAETYHRLIKLGRHIKQKREAQKAAS